jgi:DNA-binding winged helix-turn-helix (wHTH) protein
MVYYVGDCVLDGECYELRRAGAVVAIEPKVFQVLVHLIQHRDRMVTRDELLEHCWCLYTHDVSTFFHTLGHCQRAVTVTLSQDPDAP